MMEAAELRRGNNLRAHEGIHRSCPDFRRLFPQPKMHSVFVIMANVLGHPYNWQICRAK